MEKEKPKKKKIVKAVKEQEPLKAEVVNEPVKEEKVEVKEKIDEFFLPITTVKTGEDWLAKMPDGDKEWQGIGTTPLDSVRDLLKTIELDGIKDEREKAKRYMLLNFDNAKALCLQILEILGPAAKDWWTVYQLTVKTGEKTEILNKKLQLLETYGLLYTDRKSGAGLRWKVTDTKILQVDILQRKIEDAKTEIDLLQFQMDKMLLNEQTPVTKS